ncbi:hypothetical protein NHX12_030707 [Muraenolepis orangiensis]|uniref:Inter-alpha-trypsin inhibitor heavy chain C-terminal domain-containing protein n=1 Tax=Muraenolepis orangiensis TaxID=630683 RepID=A0A9Q0EAQ1_9TELE|nr:hypothetical protein NHX12_030707 [Muraenolepis orangiensis]
MCLFVAVASSSRSYEDVDGDPHFMIELPERDDALCFNINDSPGTIFNLVRDPASGFLVNAELVAKKMKKGAVGGKVNTYVGRLGVVHQTLGVRLEVTTKGITLSQDSRQVKLLWSDPSALRGPGMNLTLTKDQLTVSLRDCVRFRVVRHTKVWRARHLKQDYLGFYTLESHRLSQEVHGLLGQFYHGVEFEVGDLRSGVASLYVKGHQLNVTRGWQRDFREDVRHGEQVPCWLVPSSGAGLIDGRASDYVVSGLFKTDRKVVSVIT